MSSWGHVEVAHVSHVLADGRTLSGGQQARPQILLLELTGATLLLLDEPTGNLDLPSAEALQEGLESYQGTVLAVTHDRLVRALVRAVRCFRVRRQRPRGHRASLGFKRISAERAVVRAHGPGLRQS